MLTSDDKPAATGAQAADDDDRLSDVRLEAAGARLAAIDAEVFAGVNAIPFYEQSVLIRRAVIRLLGDG